MAELRVLFFGAVRQAVKCSEVNIICEDSPIDAGLLWEKLLQKYPDLEPLKASTRMARNHEYLPADGLVSDGDEIALIPPVSGG